MRIINIIANGVSYMPSFNLKQPFKFILNTLKLILKHSIIFARLLFVKHQRQHSTTMMKKQKVPSFTV